MPAARASRFRVFSLSPAEGSGSGFIVDRSGLVLANRHVIGADEEIEGPLKLIMAR
jgi:S1-C subfamily serine protease